MNKKALKPIIITVAVLVLIVVAFLLLRLIPESDSLDGSPSPSPTTATETVYLYQEGYYDLKRMEFEFRDGKDIAIDVDDSTDVRIFKFSPAQDGWSYDQDALRATAFNIISVSAIAKSAENVTDFSNFELDDPLLIARSYYETDGEEVVHEIHFGKMTAVEDSYYARNKGESTVYAVSRYTVENLMTTELQYRELDFFPSYLSEDQMTVEATGSITNLRIRNEVEGLDLEIRARTDKELENLPMGSTRYVMTRPVESDCNDSVIDDKLINVAAAIKVSAVVEDEPEDLSKYGLDEPLDIWLTNTNGDEIHYLIGDGAGTSAYAMVEGVDTVLLVDMFSPTLRELNHIDYMFKLLWIYNINDVKTIVFDIEGDRRLLEIRTNEKDEDGKVVKFDAVLDGRPITETNTRRLYMRMLNMMIDGELTESIDIEATKPDFTFTITMINGSTEELRLFALNERQYAGSLNGGDALYYINISNIRNLKEAFEYIARNEEIPR